MLINRCPGFAADRARFVRARPRASPANRVALDRGSVRTLDANGHLHIAAAHISKANVCPYRGSEIPDADRLGLAPDGVYRLLRDPEELRRAAPTFDNLPLLIAHRAVSADDHRRELVVGATGTDARFADPYLDNSLVVWDGAAIAAIESGDQRELSCGYSYDADMTPGTFRGERYDGVMRNIAGNHVALVERGRAGRDVTVGDQMPELDNDTPEPDTDPVSELLTWLGERLAPEDIAEAERLVMRAIGDRSSFAADEPPPFAGRPRPGGGMDPTRPSTAADALLRSHVARERSILARFGAAALRVRNLG